MLLIENQFVQVQVLATEPCFEPKDAHIATSVMHCKRTCL